MSKLIIIFIFLNLAFATENLDFSKCDKIREKGKVSKEFELCKFGKWDLFLKSKKIHFAEFNGESKIHVTPIGKEYQVKIYNPKNISDIFISKVSERALIDCLGCKSPLLLDNDKKIVCLCSKK